MHRRRSAVPDERELAECAAINMQADVMITSCRVAEEREQVSRTGKSEDMETQEHRRGSTRRWAPSMRRQEMAPGCGFSRIQQYQHQQQPNDDVRATIKIKH